MDHVAIMKKSWGLTEKILSGKKKIESRWYSNKYKPWDAIKAGDKIYFKNSGEPVKIKAVVKKIMQFSDLDPAKVRNILDKYRNDIGIEATQMEGFFGRLKDKRYCILLFLKDSTAIKPFHIDKTGFGAMSSWIVVRNISSIRR